jgi:sigma-B regulation protein RsbU (phosphoserine phosphatase)
MPGPFHLTAESWRVLKIPGLPPGLFAEAEYETNALKLEPGDSVLFCSDGLTDAFNIKNEPFGADRLQKFCQTGLRIAPRELLRRVFAAVETFTGPREQHDDMAAAVFHLRLLTNVRS